MTDGIHLTIRRGAALADRGGDGPPLLLLHGLPGSSREMPPSARVLGDAVRVLLMDQRGHGSGTQRPADLTREAFVDDVVHVLEQHAPAERCVLVGQSMGAHTAFRTAAARPGLVERLVQRTIEAVREPRWKEWEALQVPTLAIFAKDGMFSDADKDELIWRRPATDRIDLSGSHDAHLDAFDEWISPLRRWLLSDTEAGAAR